MTNALDVLLRRVARTGVGPREADIIAALGRGTHVERAAARHAIHVASRRIVARQQVADPVGADVEIADAVETVAEHYALVARAADSTNVEINEY